jgi:hypothetical protein
MTSHARTPQVCSTPDEAVIRWGALQYCSIMTLRCILDLSRDFPRCGVVLICASDVL